MSEYVSPHYEYTLILLADSLVTPERFGGAVVVANEIPVENLQGLWD